MENNKANQFRPGMKVKLKDINLKGRVDCGMNNGLIRVICENTGMSDWYAVVRPENLELVESGEGIK